MHHIARLIGRLVAVGFGLGLALVLGACVASAHPLPYMPGGSFNGGNTIGVNQYITQGQTSNATANAYGSPWGGNTYATAVSAPYQYASNSSYANIGPFGGRGSDNCGKTIGVTQGINEYQTSDATANAGGAPWGNTYATAISAPDQYASNSSYANIGGFGGYGGGWQP